MKIICNDINKEYLKNVLKDYSHIDITIVEKGLDYEGVCYYFSLDKLDNLIQYLIQLDDRYVIGYIHDREYRLNPSDIVYIEGFSKEAYIHTLDKQYRTTKKLYELEEVLMQYNFIRINKAMILNMKYIEFLIPDVQRRYVIVLKNKEKLLLTRNYVMEFKNKWKGRSL